MCLSGADQWRESVLESAPFLISKGEEMNQKKKQIIEKVGGKCFICDDLALLEAKDEPGKFICDRCWELVVKKKVLITQSDHNKEIENLKDQLLNIDKKIVTKHGKHSIHDLCENCVEIGRSAMTESIDKFIKKHTKKGRHGFGIFHSDFSKEEQWKINAGYARGYLKVLKELRQTLKEGGDSGCKQD